jgi:hypothetical protein
MQGQAQRALAADTRQIALQDLASNASVLAERLGVIKRDALPAAWARFGAGDSCVFVQAFLNFAGSHPDIAERIGEAAVRDQAARTALAGFVRRFEQVADLSAHDKLLRAVIEEGALGRGYRLFKQADKIAAYASAPEAYADEPVEEVALDVVADDDEEAVDDADADDVALGVLLPELELDGVDDTLAERLAVLDAEGDAVEDLDRTARAQQHLPHILAVRHIGDDELRVARCLRR